MKRTGFLIERIADLDNLSEAYIKACRGKRDRQEVKDFSRTLDCNIHRLRRGILSGDISIGEYTFFTIADPKQRRICAASFPERVLHHAIINICHPYFDRTLIDDSYATRPDKGIYSALDKVGKSCRRFHYVAKLDVRKYFDSIRHDILKERLRRLFKDPGLLDIFDRIIDSYSVGVDKGLPIGNLTSQYFANYYLSSLDHYIKEQLRVPIYIRYMDDMLLFRNDRTILYEDVKSIVDAAGRIGLQMKPPVIVPCYKGVAFLGYKSYPYKRLLEKRSKRRFQRKMELYADYLNDNVWTQQEYAEHVIPLLAFVSKADSHQFRLSVLKRVMIEGL